MVISATICTRTLLCRRYVNEIWSVRVSVVYMSNLVKINSGHVLNKNDPKMPRFSCHYVIWIKRDKRYVYTMRMLQVYHAYNISRFWHLIIDPSESRSHFICHCAYNSHEVFCSLGKKVRIAFEEIAIPINTQ